MNRWRQLTSGAIWAAWGAVALLSACRGDAATGIVVEVTTDLCVPDQVDAFRIRVKGADGTDRSLAPLDATDGGLGSQLPGRFMIAPEDPARVAGITVSIDALFRGRPVVTRTAEVRFRRGAVLFLPMALLARCSCSCGDHLTCEEGGACVPAVKDQLPEYAARSQPGDAGPPSSSRACPVLVATGAPDEAPGSRQCSSAPAPVTARADGGTPDGAGTGAGVDAPPAGAPGPEAGPRDTRPPPDTFAGAGNGAACTTAAECASGFCIDGLCCDRDCRGLCIACAAVKTGAGNGVCAPVTAPIACGNPGCNGSVYAPAPVCNGKGDCAPSVPRDCAPIVCSLDGCLADCQSNDNNCVGATYCDVSGCVGQKDLGASCGRDRECRSGHCIAVPALNLSRCT
jgi:hypothetical protein